MRTCRPPTSTASSIPPLREGLGGAEESSQEGAPALEKEGRDKKQGRREVGQWECWIML